MANILKVIDPKISIITISWVKKVNDNYTIANFCEFIIKTLKKIIILIDWTIRIEGDRNKKK